MIKKAESQCVVSAADHARYWEGRTDWLDQFIAELKPAKYSGPERRANAHDRRFYNGQGGRRMLDKKS